MRDRGDAELPDEPGGPAPQPPVALRGLAACEGCGDVMPASRLTDADGRQLCRGCAGPGQGAAPSAATPAAIVRSVTPPRIPDAAVGAKFRPRPSAMKESSLDDILADPFEPAHRAGRPDAPPPSSRVSSVVDDDQPARPVIRTSRSYASSAGGLPQWSGGTPAAPPPATDAGRASQTSSEPVPPERRPLAAALRMSETGAAPPSSSAPPAAPRIVGNQPPGAAPGPSRFTGNTPPGVAQRPASPPKFSAPVPVPPPKPDAVPAKTAPGTPAKTAAAATPEIRGQLSRAVLPPWEQQAERDDTTTATKADDGDEGDDSVTAESDAPEVRVRPVHAALGAPVARNAGAVEHSFEAYAALRRQIDEGDDTLDTRRRAAETASRLGLSIEAAEHYKRCVELDPADERLRMKLENVQRVAAVGDVGSSSPLPQRRVAEESRPFWEDLGSALAYPFQGSGATVLLVGGVCFAAAELITSINVFGLVLVIMLWGYVFAHLFEVINHTGAGKTTPPQLPEATNVLESYVFPFFAALTCAAASFSPFLVVCWASFRGWLPPSVGIAFALVTFAAGFFLLPMTLMVRAMFQSLGEAVNPALVLGSIGRTFPDYLAMFIATCALWIGYGVACGILYAACWFTLGRPDASAILQLDGSRIVSWVFFTLVSWPLFLYALTLQGHLLGRLYRQGLRRLAWFVPPTDATVGARGLSAGLAVAAVFALAALGGAAWGAGVLVQRAIANPNASSFGAKCPVGDGSSLTYFWENTDGLAGLTEYTFDGQPDGTLRVSAVTRIAGDSGGPSSETVGIFDPDTGVFTDAVSSWGQGVRHDGRKGRHVAFYGPKSASVGTSYVNDWVVKEPARWRSVWSTWRVHDDESTTDRFYDTRSGVLVGSSFKGVGFVVTEWLVASKNVVGAPPGIPPNRDFSTPGANPYEGVFPSDDR